MDPNQPRKAGQLFEYFLYTAIILENRSGSVRVQGGFPGWGLGSLKIYFGLLYYAFLAWAVNQLNKLHGSAGCWSPSSSRNPSLSWNRSFLQSPVASETAPASTRKREHSRLLSGLTIAQFATAVIRFGTAVATYSWAFSVLRSGQ
jgi:hypothetical protein